MNDRPTVWTRLTSPFRVATRPVRGLAGLLRRRPPAEEPEEQAPTDETPANDASAPNGGDGANDSFMLSLDALLAETTGQFYTKLHVVSLIEFREAVGLKWHKLAEKVMMIAEAVLSHHIGNDGFFARQGEDFFVIAFRGLTEEQGRARAATAANELGRRLLGNQFTEGAIPLALAAEVSAAAALNPDGSLNVEALREAVSQARTEIVLRLEASGGALPPLAGFMPGDPFFLRRHLQPNDYVPPTDPDGLRRHLAPGEGPSEPPPPSAPSAALAPSVREPRQPLSPAPAAHSATPVMLNPEFQPAPPEAVGEFGLVFRPVWIAEREALGAAECLVQRKPDPEGKLMTGGAAYPVSDPSLTFAIDRTLTHAVTAMLSKDDPEGKALILPLALTTLIATRRIQVTGPLGDLPDRVRARRLIIEIRNLPEGVTVSQLSEGVAAARRLTRTIAVRTNPSLLPAAALVMESRAGLIGMDFNELPPNERNDDELLIEHLARLRDVAVQAGLAPYVWNIRRRTVLSSAVKLGFAFLNGPALMKEQAVPGHVIKAPREKLTPRD